MRACFSVSGAPTVSSLQIVQVLWSWSCRKKGEKERDWKGEGPGKTRGEKEEGVKGEEGCNGWRLA